ncbi:hypothetical protein HMPREF0880_03545 [Yokenella regensburgei ATCC 43003]|nr:hypothetical protein HMPREF0880_03545 [Yokenella regensburgei ATCC 43003]
MGKSFNFSVKRQSVSHPKQVFVRCQNYRSGSRFWLSAFYIVFINNIGILSYTFTCVWNNYYFSTDAALRCFHDFYFIKIWYI